MLRKSTQFTPYSYKALVQQSVKLTHAMNGILLCRAHDALKWHRSVLVARDKNQLRRKKRLPRTIHAI